MYDGHTDIRTVKRIRKQTDGTKVGKTSEMDKRNDKRIKNADG